MTKFKSGDLIISTKTKLILQFLKYNVEGNNGTLSGIVISNPYGYYKIGYESDDWYTPNFILYSRVTFKNIKII